MILTPEDEQGKGLPSRMTFAGVGSSRPSLCASPDDDKAALDLEKEDSENIGKDHSDDEINKSPVTSGNIDNRTSEHEIVDDDDDQSRSDHHEDDVDARVVSGSNQNDNDVYERKTDPKKSEDEDDVGNKRDDSRYSDDNVNGDDGMKCPTPENEDVVVDDSSCNALSDDKLLSVMQQDEHETFDDDHRDPSILHPTNEPALTNPASNLQDSISADPRDSSSSPPAHHTLELNQQGSTRSLRSSTSRQHGESSRRYSDSSRRSGRSSSVSSSLSSSASSTESSSGRDSGSSSSDSNSDSESYSSSSSSSSSSGSDSCSSDSGSSSSGTESKPSSDGEAESDDVDASTSYPISSKKYERVSSRDSGRSSSFSFASERHTDMKTKMKSRGKSSRKTKKSPYTPMTQHGKYKELDGEVRQESCSTVCVLL